MHSYDTATGATKKRDNWRLLEKVCKVGGGGAFRGSQKISQNAFATYGLVFSRLWWRVLRSKEDDEADVGSVWADCANADGRADMSLDGAILSPSEHEVASSICPPYVLLSCVIFEHGESTVANGLSHFAVCPLLEAPTRAL
jgi:hypothetical protein